MKLIDDFRVDTERNMAVQFLRSKGIVDERMVELLIEYSHLCGHFVNKAMDIYQEHLNICSKNTFITQGILKQ